MKYKQGQTITHNKKKLVVVRVIPQEAKKGAKSRPVRMLICRDSKGKRIDVTAAALAKKSSPEQPAEPADGADE